MARNAPDEDTRNAHLKALEDAFGDDDKGYYKKEKERLEKEVDFLNAVLNSRGFKSTAMKSLRAATEKAAFSIDSFLTGE